MAVRLDISVTENFRWGLCCQFVDASVRFRQATHRHVSTMPVDGGRRYLTDVLLANAVALVHAIERCHELGIGAFRISSQIAPLATHPVSGYALESLPNGDAIVRTFVAARALARLRDVRLSFHPDQFVVLNSEREHVARSSAAELEFQGEMAELVGADTICLHGGAARGGKGAALDRLERAIDGLSARARARLALENDDRCFTPADLLPLCERAGVPLVYDVHHHRTNPDGLDEREATERASETWSLREQWVHISSPRDAWSGANPRAHADYIDPADFPAAWHGRRLTIDVEAKAKELAVAAIRRAM